MPGGFCWSISLSLSEGFAITDFGDAFFYFHLQQSSRLRMEGNHTLRKGVLKRKENLSAKMEKTQLVLSAARLPFPATGMNRKSAAAPHCQRNSPQ